MFSNPLYYVAIIICLVAVGGLYYLRKRSGWIRHGKKEGSGFKESNEEVEEGDILCRIADNITGRIYNAWITKKQTDEIIEEHKTLGRQWFRDGKRIYGLNRYEVEVGTIKLRPITIPSQITNAPSELHNDMQQPEIVIIMNELLKDEDKPFIEKYGQILWWIAVMGFLAFMWSQS